MPKRYPAVIDRSEDAWGVTFVDLPGICAAGGTLDEALARAAEALADAAAEYTRDGEPLPAPSPLEDVRLPEGAHALTAIPLVRPTGKARRANLTLDEGVLDFIDSEARRRGMTRKAFIEWMAHFVARTAA